MVRTRRKRRASRRKNPALHFGYQWGDSLDGDGQLLVEHLGTELKIVAALPDYQSGNHPCDLVRHYSDARKNRSIGKQRTGKDSPHIRFANADGDGELIRFVRNYGPVLCVASSMRPAVAPKKSFNGAVNQPARALLEARQDLEELRIEQKIYRATFHLILELAKEETNYDREDAQKQIIEIARGVQDWPHQWQREKKERGKDPLWRVRTKSIQRIVGLAKSTPNALLPPQLDARIVICEILNAFPSLVFPNPAEMHSYIRFGIRPLLYSLLRREFLQPREVGVCANTRCREFFEIERKGQRFCNEICSRHQRQREYWKASGKTLRNEKLSPQAQSNK